MNVLTNLIYGSDEIKEEKIEKTVELGKSYIISGVISSIEEWEHHYVKINEKVLILKQDNVNFDDLLKKLKINDVASLNYIRDEHNNLIISTSNKIFYASTTITGLETDSFGDTYVTTSPAINYQSKTYNLILKRNYFDYCKLYSKLNKDETFLLIIIFYKKSFRIVDIKNPINLVREITVTGAINIGKEIDNLKDFAEIIYKNHQQGFRFLISSNDLKEQHKYKITCVKFHSEDFYKIISYEEIL